MRMNLLLLLAIALLWYTSPHPQPCLLPSAPIESVRKPGREMHPSKVRSFHRDSQSPAAR
jgi:hypothetical protein